MDDLTKQIITDSAILVTKTAELQDQAKTAAQKNANLEKQATDLALQVSGLQKAATDTTEKIASAAQALLQPYVDRQVVTADKVAAALELIRQDPSQVVDVIGKIANAATAQQIGGGDTSKEADGEKIDPIEAFAMR